MIWLDESQYCLRIIDGDPAARPPYRAVGNIYIHGDVAILSGFHGKVMRADLREFLAKMRERKINHLILERTGNHRFPFASAINTPGGPFHGWWHIDMGAINV